MVKLSPLSIGNGFHEELWREDPKSNYTDLAVYCDKHLQERCLIIHTLGQSFCLMLPKSHSEHRYKYSAD